MKTEHIFPARLKSSTVFRLKCGGVRVNNTGHSVGSVLPACERKLQHKIAVLTNMLSGHHQFAPWCIMQRDGEQFVRWMRILKDTAQEGIKHA